MIDTNLVPERTVVTAKGDGPPVDISGSTNRVFLVTLHIVNIVEQESLDVSIFGSSDGVTWGTKPIAAFPQKFYRGQHPMLLDLSQTPDIKFLRAHWEVNRWGRGDGGVCAHQHRQSRQSVERDGSDQAGGGVVYSEP